MTNRRRLIIPLLLAIFLILIGGWYYTRIASNHYPMLPPSSGAPARLAVKGSQILDPSGNPIVLRGFNWGGWGSAQPEDGTDNVSQGANAVRLPLRWWGPYGTFVFKGQTYNTDSFDPNSPQTGYINPANLAYLDQTIEWASNAHLWIDLFVDSDCGQGSISNSPIKICGDHGGGTPNNFDNDPAMLAKFTALWQFLANRYKDTPYMGMYEVMPEPNFDCTQGGLGSCDLAFTKQFYISLIDSIRTVDPNTPFLIGGGGGYSVKALADAYIATTTPIIYTADYLDGGSNNPQTIGQYVVPFVSEHHVPFFVQQVGVKSGDSNAAASAAGILSALNKNDIGWTWWTYRDQGVNADNFGVWYQNADGSWTEKPDWLALISKYLKDATQ